MLKKILTLCLAILFLSGNFVFAKKKDPEPELADADKVKIFVEVEDKTTFRELDTAEILRGIISEQLAEKNIFNLIDYSVPEEKFSDLKTLGEKQSASDIGELLYFNPAELSYGAGDDADLIQEKYLSRGIDYVLKCQILALGTTTRVGEIFNPGFGIGIGSHRRSRFGFGIYTPLPIQTKNVYYCAAMNVQFIKVDTNIVLWQRNLIGQAIRHKKPSKGFDNASDEAYLKSLKDASKIVSERVFNYSKKFLIPKPETEKENSEKKK